MVSQLGMGAFCCQPVRGLLLRPLLPTLPTLALVLCSVADVVGGKCARLAVVVVLVLTLSGPLSCAVSHALSRLQSSVLTAAAPLGLVGMKSCVNRQASHRWIMSYARVGCSRQLGVILSCSGHRGLEHRGRHGQEDLKHVYTAGREIAHWQFSMGTAVQQNREEKHTQPSTRSKQAKQTQER